MKKIIIFLLASTFFFSQASAVGLNIGISGSAGVFHATGEENEAGEIASEEATGTVGWGSVFVELAASDRLAFGVEYVPYALDSEATLNEQSDGGTVTTNTMQIDFENLASAYVMLNVTENLYVRAGILQVDVITNESLGTGSAYNDTDLEGSIGAIGYSLKNDDGVFLRVEGNYMSFDDDTLTSTTNSDNKVTLNGLEGVSGKIMVGKSF
tara:strand:+ start:373 stop:1005 length:633 start_codon:yes stop_codon:yes gene_type:complete